MEDKPPLPGSVYLLARLSQKEAYDVCDKSHLVRVRRARLVSRRSEQSEGKVER